MARDDDFESHRSLESEDERREIGKKEGRKEGRNGAKKRGRRKRDGDVSRVAIVIQIGWKLFSERHLDPVRSSKMAPHEYIIGRNRTRRCRITNLYAAVIYRVEGFKFIETPFHSLSFRSTFSKQRLKA